MLPSGGLGSSGGGPQRRLHGEGRIAAGLVAGGDVLVVEGGSGRVCELQEAEELPFYGLVRVEEGRRWGFIVGRISPAILGGGGAPRRVWWLWALEYALERTSVR